MNKFLLSTLSLFLAFPAFAGELKFGSDDGPGAKLYGFARVDVIYSDTRLNHPQFPSFVPATDEPESELDIHARLTRLGLAYWSGDLDEGIHVDGKLELDFQGGGSQSRANPRMRHAYGVLHVGNFRLLTGQTWHLVSQLFPSANSDSLMWNAGNAGDRAAQIRAGYRIDIGDDGSVDIQAAAVMPNVVDQKDVDDDGKRTIMNGGMPGIQGRIAFAKPMWTTKPLKVAVSTAYAVDNKTDPTINHEAGEKTTEGYFAELVVPFLDNWGIRGEWFMGQNLSDLRGGIGQGLNDAGKEIQTMGFWGETYFAPIDSVKIAAGYSEDTPEKNDLDDGAREKNATIYGVLGYRPWTVFRVQAEYIRWTTSYKAGDEISANRANLHFTYFF